MGLATNVPGFTSRRLAVVLGALILAVFLGAIEGTIIATALPTITGEFNAFESFAWVGTAYSVTAAIATPLFGKLSDLYGRRLLIQSALAIFVVGSILCGAASSIEFLIFARAVQGLGGGSIQALAFAVIGDIIPPRERGRYIGFFTFAWVSSSLLGPLVGGAIIEHWSWPWIFYVNVPFALVCIGVCHVALRLPFQRREATIDWAGAGLLSASIAALMIALEFAHDGWTQPRVLMLLVGSAVIAVAFVAVERRAVEPMIPLRLFRNRSVVLCVLLGFLAAIVMFGAGQFLPLYFQDSLFVSPTRSGLYMLPQMAGVTAATFGIGMWIARTGRYKRVPIIGSVCAIVGLVGIAQIDGSTAYPWLLVPMALVGFGGASVFTTSSIAGQNAVEMSDLGVTTSTMMFFRGVGGSIGIAAFGTLLTSTIRTEIPARASVQADEAANLIRSPEEIRALPDGVRDAVVDSVALGVSRIYWLCAVAMAAALVVALALPEKPLRTRATLSDAMEHETAAAAHG